MQKLNQKSRNNYKIFLPLLSLYVFLVLIFSQNELFHDEGTYIKYSTNLVAGYYSPKDNIKLTNGPGFPLILSPFILLKIPLKIVRLINAFFLFFAILYFFYTLCLYLKTQSSVFFTYLLGIYPPILKWLPFLMTDVLAFFLV